MLAPLARVSRGSARHPLLLSARLFSSTDGSASSSSIMVKMATTESLPGHQVVAYNGFVTASTVLARNVFVDGIAQFQSAVGGELNHYAKLADSAVCTATSRLQDEAHSRGANAIVGVRMSTKLISQASEVTMIGTAVTVVPDQ